MMPPAYVKPYIRRQKIAAASAAAICEAVTRPSMRFVPVKDIDQQAVLMMHRARNLLVSSADHGGQCAARASGRVRRRRVAGSAPCRMLGRSDRRKQSWLAGIGAVDPAAHRGPIGRHAGQGPADRGEAGAMASQQPPQQAPCDGSGRRNHGGERDCSHGQRSKPVPVWARIRGLARHDAAAEFLRRQEAAGANQQTRRQIHSLPTRRGGRRRSAASARPRMANGCARCWRGSRRRGLRPVPLDPERISAQGRPGLLLRRDRCRLERRSIAPTR
jgi:hypothetical protein